MTEKEIVSALRVTESRSKRELLDAAADLIEKLTDRCARYAEEIAVAQERTRWIPRDGAPAGGFHAKGACFCPAYPRGHR